MLNEFPVKIWKVSEGSLGRDETPHQTRQELFFHKDSSFPFIEITLVVRNRLKFGIMFRVIDICLETMKKITIGKTKQPANEATNLPTNQTANQTTCQPINQLTNRQINKPTNQ